MIAVMFAASVCGCAGTTVRSQSTQTMPRRLDCVGTVVVSFAPPLPASEREQYWAEVVELAGGSA
jgi:hypothetical protein